MATLCKWCVTMTHAQNNYHDENATVSGQQRTGPARGMGWGTGGGGGLGWVDVDSSRLFMFTNKRIAHY